jgi:hypothetical protein
MRRGLTVVSALFGWKGREFLWREGLTGYAAERTPQEEDVGSKFGRVVTVSYEVGSDDTDDAVPEPLFLYVNIY